MKRVTEGILFEYSVPDEQWQKVWGVLDMTIMKTYRNQTLRLQGKGPRTQMDVAGGSIMANSAAPGAPVPFGFDVVGGGGSQKVLLCAETERDGVKWMTSLYGATTGTAAVSGDADDSAAASAARAMAQAWQAPTGGRRLTNLDAATQSDSTRQFVIGSVADHAADQAAAFAERRSLKGLPARRPTDRLEPYRYSDSSSVTVTTSALPPSPHFPASPSSRPATARR